MLSYLYLCFRAYRLAKKHGLCFASITNRGVTEICVFVGLDRHAWVISQQVIESLSQ